QVTVTPRNKDNIVLTDRDVELEVDAGYFTDNSTTRSWHGLTPATTPTEGAPVGAWHDHGQSEPGRTSDRGRFTATVAVDRFEALDARGEADVTLKATIGGKTESEGITFRSGNPLNPGEVELKLAAHQTVGVLPKAPTTETVFLDVIAKDQFGNRIDQNVEVDDTSAAARINGVNGPVNISGQFLGEDPAELSATAANNQVVKGE